jgi:pyruvate dehydrogenase E1 component alpha subunit
MKILDKLALSLYVSAVLFISKREFMPLKKIAKFDVSHLQILDENGKLDEKLDPKLSDTKLMEFYRAMVYARETDSRMLKLQRQGRVGTFASATGQEAATCAVGMAMSETDWLCGAYREPGIRYMRGETFQQYLEYFNGYEEGSRRTGRTLPIQVLIAAQNLHATGIAYAMKYQGEKDTAAVAFFGDGATSEGDFHEALNFASVWKVPVIFVCLNNQWAISTPRKGQTNASTIAQKAIAYDVPGLQVDGNDPLAMYRAVDEALKRAKKGDGPTLIEAITYRLLMHTTADDPKRYRPDDEVESWWEKDPLIRFEKYLGSKKLLDEAKKKEIYDGVFAEIEENVKAFETPKEYKPDTPFDYIFGTEVKKIEEQRQEFLEMIQAEGDDA